MRPLTLQNTNLSLAVLWALSAFLYRLSGQPVFQITQGLSTFFVIFIFSGTSLVYFFHSSQSNLYQNPFVLLSIGIIVSIFFIPSALLLAAVLFGLKSAPPLVFIYLIILLVPFGRRPYDFSFSLKPSPVFISLCILAFITVLNISHYPFLPALDPYSWVVTYEQELDGLYDYSYGPSRILFSTLVAIFQLLTQIDYYHIFKYWFPFLSLLSVFPLKLIANSFTSRFWQLFILLSALSSPVLVLDFTMTRHQSVLILFIYLSSGLLLIAHRYKLHSIYNLTFISCLLGALYHPLFTIFAVIWFIGWLNLYRQYFLQHRIILLFVTIFFLLLAHTLQLTIVLINTYFRLAASLANFISFNWNLKFPTSFISESVQMGWPGFFGPAKYYGYYAGPFTIIFTITLLLLLLFSRRRFSLRSTLTSPFLLPISMLGVLFFALAEILPRFFNTAFLPDRALLFLSVTFPLFVYALHKSYPLLFRIPAIKILAFACLLLSVIGGLYINNGFAYTIPDYEFRAATWINNNLPAERIMLSSSSKNLLRYHASSKILRLDDSLIIGSNLDDILHVIEKHNLNPATQPVYIYYALTHPRNPYQTRHYASSFTGVRSPSSFPALSSAPQQFRLIYIEPDSVYIWQVLPKNK